MSICCKAVIFDLDGTILDTLEDLADSMNLTLTKFGFPEKELAHHRKAIGNGLRKYAERCIPENSLSEELLDEFIKVAANDYKNNCTKKTKPFDGIFELLDFLVKNSISINVLSNKRNEFVKKLTAHYFPDFEFECVYGELPGIPKKPNPAAALKIAQDINIPPENILIIGDSTFDIITGKNAKMQTLAVTWGNQDKDLLNTENPDCIAECVHEIKNYIKKINQIRG